MGHREKKKSRKLPATLCGVFLLAKCKLTNQSIKFVMWKKQSTCKRSARWQKLANRSICIAAQTLNRIEWVVCIPRIRGIPIVSTCNLLKAKRLWLIYQRRNLAWKKVWTMQLRFNNRFYFDSYMNTFRRWEENEAYEMVLKDIINSEFNRIVNDSMMKLYWRCSCSKFSN